MSEKKQKFFKLSGLIILFLATTPIFFNIYRSAVFNTMPRDDYAPYLLHIIGAGGGLPGAPFAYRILSVMIAVPFYYLLPVYQFSNLTNIDLSYLKATEALSMVSYICLVLTAVVIYLIARRKYKSTEISALFVAGFTFILSYFISTTGIDPIAILVISILILILENPLFFSAMIVLSIGINEKIAILFATILFFRFIYGLYQKKSFKFTWQLILSICAVIGYFVVKAILKIPGNADQTDLSLFFPHILSSIKYSLSIKGLFLNILPIAILGMLYALAFTPGKRESFCRTDLSALLILILLSFISDVVYNVGRVVMYSYPFYLPVIACLIDDIFVFNKKEVVDVTISETA